MRGVGREDSKSSGKELIFSDGTLHRRHYWSSFEFIFWYIEYFLRKVYFRDLCKDKDFLIISDCPEVFCKEGVIRNFPKFTGKYLCQSPFFDKVTGFFKNFFFDRTPPVAEIRFILEVIFGEYIYIYTYTYIYIYSVIKNECSKA